VRRPNVWIFVAGLFLVVLVIATASLAAQPAKKVRLAYSAFAYANPPFWIAHDLKLFEKYGLDTELVYLSAPGPSWILSPSNALRLREKIPRLSLT
jgi:ABC-type nitrate/sulfonate/bicarbonate transport system substrate-binding protein